MRRGRHAKKEEKRLTGAITVTGRGMGFFLDPITDTAIEIPRERLNTALNGDIVEITARRRGPVAEGEVVKIKKRAKKAFVGTVGIIEGACLLIPDDRRLYTKLRLPDSAKKEKGQKVLARIVSWKDPLKEPEGEIAEVLGAAGNHEVEMRAIVLEKGFDLDLPQEVLKEADAIAKRREISEEEIAKRRDFRPIPTFTIDPRDAKDFDDALSVQTLPDGQVEIGIHIADVSHYVREGSPIDREARTRGTSIYLVDRTIPMLPPVLSDDICSLKEGVDRLAFSAVFTFAQSGKITDEWYGEAVINSDKRFAYEEAQEVIDKGSGKYSEELLTLNRLAKDLRQKRFQEGSIAFEQEEVRFELDEDGKPVRVYKKSRLDTHLLVEDFMLLANRKVTEHFVKKNGPGRAGKSIPSFFIYRIHDMPNADRIEDLSIYLKAVGYDLEMEKASGEKGISAKAINELFKKIEGKPEEELIKTATIRSMAKAIYSTRNIGHFGLAFKYYTHFTSPIRRYPDLVVHRILKHVLHGAPLTLREVREYERIAVSSSEREVAAAEAERASIKRKQIEFMSGKVGQTFEGIVSGVTEWGMYVEERETKAEGLVHVRNLPDFFTLDKKHYRLVGSKSRKSYSLGDPVRVKLLKADVQGMTLDFVLADN